MFIIGCVDTKQSLYRVIEMFTRELTETGRQTDSAIIDAILKNSFNFYINQSMTRTFPVNLSLIPFCLSLALCTSGKGDARSRAHLGLGLKNYIAMVVFDQVGIPVLRH